MSKSLAAALGVLALALSLTICALWLGFDTLVPPPSFERVRQSWKPSEVSLLDRNGDEIHEQRADDKRRRLDWIALADISPALQRAVLASEDRRFEAHGGVDARAMAAAAVQRVVGHGSRGASTITMQLASFLDPTLRRRGGPRSLPQKVRQMRMAWTIESEWSKPRILEAYLNFVTFSGELQGVGAAASVLYGKAPHGLSDSEALVLAALLRAPNATSPTVIKRAERLAVGSGIQHEAIAAAASRLLAVSVTSLPRVALAPHAAARLIRLASVREGTTTRIASTLDGSLQ